jgi:ubiquinone/menaquinone biosynthesis C-methylase UbiE
MNELQKDLNEQGAARAFSRQAPVFDDYDAGNTINQYKRRRVRDRVMQCLPPGASILELNAGTGLDSIWFARQGYRVHATDIAPGMLEQLAKKVDESGLRNSVTYELCSFTELEGLKAKGPYDLIFSNFAGLNCTDRLDKVLASFPSLLRPGGYVVLVVLPSFCLWETLLLFKGRFRTAFRRILAKNGASSRVEGVYFKCWYYQPSYISTRLSPLFKLKGLEGLCSFVPPSYIEYFAERHPRIYRWLVKKEERFRTRRPWRSIGDYYILTMQKEGEGDG